jgi:hypothetical protein
MVEVLEDRRLPSTVTWNGNTHDWNNPSNWLGGVPTSADDVDIFGQGSVQPILQSGETSEVKTLTVFPFYGPASVTVQGNLVVDNSASMLGSGPHGEIDVMGDGITGDGYFGIHGTLSQSGNTMINITGGGTVEADGGGNVFGDVEIYAGGLLDLEGTSSVGQHLHQGGTLLINAPSTGGGHVDEGGLMENNSGFTMNANLEFEDGADYTGNGYFYIDAFFQVDTGTWNAPIGGYDLSAAFQLNGGVILTEGTAQVVVGGGAAPPPQTAPDTMLWTSGIVEGYVSADANNGIFAYGPGPKLLTGTLDVRGDMTINTWVDGTDGNIQISHTGLIHINEGSCELMNVSNLEKYPFDTLLGTVNDDLGRFSKIGDGSSTIEVVFLDSGSNTTIQAGRLNLTGGGDIGYQLYAPPEVDVYGGASLHFDSFPSSQSPGGFVLGGSSGQNNYVQFGTGVDNGGGTVYLDGGELDVEATIFMNPTFVFDGGTLNSSSHSAFFVETTSNFVWMPSAGGFPGAVFAGSGTISIETFGRMTLENTSSLHPAQFNLAGWSIENYSTISWRGGGALNMGTDTTIDTLGGNTPSFIIMPFTLPSGDVVAAPAYIQPGYMADPATISVNWSSGNLMVSEPYAEIDVNYSATQSTVTAAPDSYGFTPILTFGRGGSSVASTYVLGGNSRINFSTFSQMPPGEIYTLSGGNRFEGAGSVALTYYATVRVQGSATFTPGVDLVVNSGTTLDLTDVSTTITVGGNCNIYGTLLMYIAKNTGEESNSQLTVSGNLILTGTLDVVLDSSSDELVPGDSFDLIHFDPTHNNTISPTLILPGLPGGETWDAGAQNGEYVITVVGG